MAATGVFPCKVITSATCAAELLDVVLIERVPSVKKADRTLNAARAYQRAAGAAVDAVNRALDAAEHELGVARVAWEAEMPPTRAVGKAEWAQPPVPRTRATLQDARFAALHEQMKEARAADLSKRELRDLHMEHVLKERGGGSGDHHDISATIPTCYTRQRGVVALPTPSPSPLSSGVATNVYDGDQAPLAAARAALNDAKRTADAAFESSVMAVLLETVRDAKLGALDAIISGMLPPTDE